MAAATTPRGDLRAALTAGLVPRLRALGFDGPAAISGNALSHEYVRANGDARQHLTVQLEKYGLPRFIVNVAIEPPQGFATIHREGGTIVSGRVKPRPGPHTQSWFRADAPWWQRLVGRPHPGPVQAVAQCVALLPEIEAWWTTQSPSTHIESRPCTFPGLRASDPDA